MINIMGYEKNIEKKTIRLKTISPIHIKGKDVDYGQGFVRRDNYSAYAIDHTKLGKYLLSKGKFEIYLEEVDRLINRRKFKKFDFQKFLKDYHLYDIDKPETHRELIDAGVFKGIVGSTNDKQFIRDGMKRPFIPGSSIKGFIRVACIYDHFKNKLFTDFRKFEREIRNYDRWLTERFRFLSVTDSGTLNIQRLKDETVSIVSRNIKNEKLLQAEEGGAKVVEVFGRIKLQTHDARLYEIDEKLFQQYSLKTGKMVSSYTLDKKGKVVIGFTVNERASIRELTIQKVVSLKFKDKEELECFNGETNFDIILNKNNPNFPFKNIEHLLEVLDSFSQKIWKLEAKYLSEITENVDRIGGIKKFYEETRFANARLGFGTGLLGKTPDGILDESMLNDLVNARIKPEKAPPHKRPKSRRMIVSNDFAILPLGWIKMGIKNDT